MIELDIRGNNMDAQNKMVGKIIYTHMDRGFGCPSKEYENCRAAIHEALRVEREEIIAAIPGGDIVDPQLICDMIRARNE